MLSAILLVVYAIGVPVGFVIAARYSESQPPDPYDDDSELRPLAALMAGLIWPLVLVLVGAVWGAERAYRLAVGGLPAQEDVDA